MNLLKLRQVRGILAKAAVTFTLVLTSLPVVKVSARAVPAFESRATTTLLAKSTPACTQKLLWYTKGSNVCAPTKVRSVYKWQASMKKSDTTKFMSTCRKFFSTKAGQMICDWVQKYVNNLIATKSPKDNCITYLQDLLNYLAVGAQTNKNITLEMILEPYLAKNSWICHSS
jgi:hypothetical protein